MSTKLSFWESLMQKNMLVVFMQGFVSGLPLLLTLRTLQAWMTDSGVDLKTTGAAALFGLPATLKFLWAPLFDRYQIKILGRRRGWMFISQVGVAISLVCMASVDPNKETLLLAIFAVMVAFFSASQDIVIDAYRREILTDEQLGLGSTFYVYGYRIAMWIAGGFALGLAQFISWNQVYLLMAGIQILTLGVTLWSSEPVNRVPPPKDMKEAVVEPFKDFLTRKGAWLLLGFVLLYKLGDTMSGNMLTPYYLKLGYEKIEIAAIAKTMSLATSLIGGLIGGIFVQRIGIYRSLFHFGILQALSTLAFMALFYVGHNNWVLGAVITFEDLTAGMGTAAFVAYMASITNRKFSATQFALLSSLMGIPRTLVAAPTGLLAESLGWPGFFTLCTVIAIPGLLMIGKIRKLAEEEPAL